MLKAYISKNSIILSPGDRRIGVRVMSLKSIDHNLGIFNDQWSESWFDEYKGTIEIIVDNEIFFYDHKGKKLYIKSNWSRTLTLIDLEREKMFEIYSKLDLEKLDSIKDTIVKLNFK